MSNEETEDMWLFGYGSLVWKPPPHYDLRVPGYIEGYVRRFWQASQDHRGTPEDPGRVVTLIDRAHWETLTDHHATAPPRIWGAAYRIPATHVAKVKEYLDIREINGYSIDYTPFNITSPKDKDQDMSAHYTTVHAAPDAKPLAPRTSSPSGAAPAEPTPASEPASTSSIPSQIKCLVYIGLPNNPQFLGPQDPQALAEKIVVSRGPSGENTEYLYQLETALEGLSAESGDEHVSDLARRCREIQARSK